MLVNRDLPKLFPNASPKIGSLFPKVAPQSCFPKFVPKSCSLKLSLGKDLRGHRMTVTESRSGTNVKTHHPTIFDLFRKCTLRNFAFAAAVAETIRRSSKIIMKKIGISDLPHRLCVQCYPFPSYLYSYSLYLNYII